MDRIATNLIGNLYFSGTYGASTHIVDTGDGLLLFDTGYKSDTDALLNDMKTLGMKPVDIRWILHTHGHIDHMGGTRKLISISGAKTYIGAADVDAASSKFDSIIQLIIEKKNAENIFNVGSDVEAANKAFANDKALFITTVVGRLFAFREMETDFGILPSAKYDESQDRYYSGVVDAWLHVVPSNNRDPERTSVIMEALASGSARYVFPAYYEKAMQQKILRDEESIKMMEIIQNTRIIDMGQCPWNDVLYRPITDRTILAKNSQSVASVVESIKNEAETTMNEIVDYINTLE